MDVLILALVVVALILGVIELVNAHGRSLLSWAVVLLAIALLLGSGIVAAVAR